MQTNTIEPINIGEMSVFSFIIQLYPFIKINPITKKITIDKLFRFIWVQSDIIPDSIAEKIINVEKINKKLAKFDFLLYKNVFNSSKFEWDCPTFKIIFIPNPKSKKIMTAKRIDVKPSCGKYTDISFPEANPAPTIDAVIANMDFAVEYLFFTFMFMKRIQRYRIKKDF